MRRQLVVLLAALFGIFLVGFVSGMAVERSLALDRLNRSALCREARQRCLGILVGSPADPDNPAVQAEVRQAEADIARHCEDRPDAPGSSPQRSHAPVAMINRLCCSASGRPVARRAGPGRAFLTRREQGGTSQHRGRGITAFALHFQAASGEHVLSCLCPGPKPGQAPESPARQAFEVARSNRGDLLGAIARNLAAEYGVPLREIA